jgi:hypothetical protein
MLKQLRESTQIVILNSDRDDNIIDGASDVSWDVLVELLSNHDLREDKDGPCILPIKMKPKNEWVKSTHGRIRNDSNVESITTAIVDLDAPGALKLAEDKFKEYDYCVYSTHSYSEATPHKFRMAIRLDEPVEAKDWRLYFAHLVAGIKADNKCGNLSRIYYLPSANPNNPPPIFKRNEGRSLTFDEVIKNGELHIKKMKNSEKMEIQKRIALAKGSTFDNKKRHFSGEIIENYGGARRINFSYESMLKRHKNQVDMLKSDDSRHGFALSVIAREVAILKGATQISPLIQFIFRAADEHSSRKLYEGNTPSEIPGMIDSAVKKFISGEDDPLKLSASDISSAIDHAKNCSVLSKWDFPSESIDLNPDDEKNEPIDEYSYENMRKRNLDLMKSLVGGISFVDFSSQVFKREIDNFGSKANINDIGQFVAFCVYSSIKHSNQVQSGNASVGLAIDKVIESAGEIANVIDYDDCDKLGRYIRSSLIMAKQPALGLEAWSIRTEKTKTNDQSREPRN